MTGDYRSDRIDTETLRQTKKEKGAVHEKVDCSFFQVSLLSGGIINVGGSVDRFDVPELVGSARVAPLKNVCAVCGRSARNVERLAAVAAYDGIAAADFTQLPLLAGVAVVLALLHVRAVVLAAPCNIEHLAAVYALDNVVSVRLLFKIPFLVVAAAVSILYNVSAVVHASARYIKSLAAVYRLDGILLTCAEISRTAVVIVAVIIVVIIVVAIVIVVIVIIIAAARRRRGVGYPVILRGKGSLAVVVLEPLVNALAVPHVHHYLSRSGGDISVCCVYGLFVNVPCDRVLVPVETVLVEGLRSVKAEVVYILVVALTACVVVELHLICVLAEKFDVDLVPYGAVGGTRVGEE